jgi:hypothetical protein
LIGLEFKQLAPKVPLFREYFSRKGAKAQSATAFLKAFFAPLRKKYFNLNSSLKAEL